MRLISLLLSTLACLSLISAERVGYQIGTAAGSQDVMNNGIPRDGWNNVVQTFFYPRDQKLRLYAILNFTGVRPAPTITTQGYSLDFVYSVPNVVIASMDPAQQAGVLQVGFNQLFDFKFSCLSAAGTRTTKITVITHFHDPQADDASFEFFKVCELPPISIGAPGPDGVHATVVNAGVPVDTFVYKSPPTEDKIVFDMWLPKPLSQYYPYYNLTMPVLTFSRFAMDLKYEMTQYDVRSIDILPYARLIITYNCDMAQPASSTEISVEMENGYASKLQFAFTKNCSYPLGPNVLHVGSSDTSNDVIQGGQPIGAWGTDAGSPLPINEHEIDFYAYINATTRLQEDILVFNVTCTVSNDNKIFIVNDGSTAPRGFVAKLQSSAGVRTKVPMDLTCMGAGHGSGTVVFSFNGIYPEVRIRFTYVCAFPIFDIDYVSTADKSKLSSVIVKNVEQPGWKGFVSPQTTKSETFAIILNGASPWEYQDITFDYVGYNASLMSPIVIPTNSWMKLSQENPIYFQILFHCVQDQPVQTIPVTIGIDYGWNVRTSISFSKTCPEIEGSASSSSGWSAAGIFFFTVFILTLVGCLTGAGYKYTKEEKRGWEVIPGITYYRACYEKACPTKRYTPQSDYYQDNVPDHGGKSYQTDL